MLNLKIEKINKLGNALKKEKSIFKASKALVDIMIGYGIHEDDANQFIDDFEVLIRKDESSIYNSIFLKNPGF